jgi:FAD/FMN-containing dehydrogenase
VTTRREFLTTALAAAGAAALPRPAAGADGVLVNDVHSKLNPTRVHSVVRPASVDDLAAAVRAARAEGRAVSVAGGRHAMGGQQFGTGTVLVDTTGMRRVLDLDPERGEVEVEAGAQWPELVGWLLDAQRGAARPWAIRQKQTGADRLSLGGAVGANVHGRGLAMKPFVGDVEAFTLVDAQGEVRRVSRTREAELFRAAVGGYGLFGLVASVRLRLAPRRKLRRVVEVFDVEDLVPAFERRIAEGYLYGDFQYSIDRSSGDFLRKGVFSCYRPVDDATPVPDAQAELSAADWGDLVWLAHVDPARAFTRYAGYYLTTSGQLYWSDTHQLGVYLDDYHAALDRRLGAAHPATEMITEIYVPRAALVRFFDAARRDFRGGEVPIVYGTVRLIERDDETVLAWAREPWACVIFNLHVEHTVPGKARAADAFRRLIDLAIALGGSYFPTYHRWATRAQVEACHPRIRDLLALKRRYDPAERFQSDWYRHYRAMFSA